MNVNKKILGNLLLEPASILKNNITQASEIYFNTVRLVQYLETYLYISYYILLILRKNIISIDHSEPLTKFKAYL